MLNSGVTSFIAAVDAFEYSSVKEATATTVLGLGSVLILLPIVFGPSWIVLAEVILGLVIATVGTSMLLTSQGAALFAYLASVLPPLDAAGQCMASLGLILFSAILFTWCAAWQTAIASMLHTRRLRPSSSRASPVSGSCKR